MTNKLTMNETITGFLNTEENPVWNYILENNADELLASLAGDEDNEIRNTIIKELFNDGESQTLNDYDFATIEDGNAALFGDVVRLVISLDINGNYEEIKEKALDTLLEAMPAITDTIRKESPGYSRKPMNALLWTEGVGMRGAMSALAYYFRQKEDTDHLHFTIMKRTGITLGIIGHYKHIVGPDMIEAAQIKEKLGENEAAIGFYEAVRDDFGKEIDWFVATPEAGPNEEDVTTLQSLKEAYISLDRLKESNEYGEKVALIDEILSREIFEEPDFDDDEDDEE